MKLPIAEVASAAEPWLDLPANMRPPQLHHSPTPVL
jgi:hypothetical protein